MAPATMLAIKEDLQAQDGFIKEILEISGAPAISVGVLHDGNIIHTAHYGTREVGKQLTPTDDTMYRLGSLTKLITASAVALLVDDGKLDWDTPIREYLPDFRERHDDIGQKATVRDLLSMRTGIAGGDHYWGQQHGEFLLPHDELVPMAVHVAAVKPFRKKFLYSGWNYALVTETIESVAGMTIGNFINQRLLQPLGMKRTTLADTSNYDNVSMGYAIHTDGSPYPLPFQQTDDGIGLAGSFGGKSSLGDLLMMYREILNAKENQKKSKLHNSPGSPFKYTKEIFEPHVNIYRSTDYCLGLYKTPLPGRIGIGSLNTFSLLGLDECPILGGNRDGLEVWHHTGRTGLSLASVLLVPETRTAVVAISNARGLIDPTDLVTQQLLAVVLGEKLNKPLIDFAKAARSAGLIQYPKLHSKLLGGMSGNCNRPAQSYEGHYWHSARNFCLTIVLNRKGGLQMKVQDVPRTRYNLEPYHGDVWWWPPDRKDELCIKGMNGFMHPTYHLISFSSSSNDEIDRLTWQPDPAASPETFYRRNLMPKWKGHPFPKAKL